MSSSKSKYLGSITSQAAKEHWSPVGHPKGGNLSYEGRIAKIVSVKLK